MGENGWTGVPIPNEQATRLDDLRVIKRAGTKMPSRASLVREAVEDYLKKHEQEVESSG